jgi:hypothetical protein
MDDAAVLVLVSTRAFGRPWECGLMFDNLAAFVASAFCGDLLATGLGWRVEALI